jgi:hypothetical protein
MGKAKKKEIIIHSRESIEMAVGSKANSSGGTNLAKNICTLTLGNLMRKDYLQGKLASKSQWVSIKVPLLTAKSTAKGHTLSRTTLDTRVNTSTVSRRAKAR